MITVLESLNSGLQRALASSPDVILLGEDVLDSYGGAFKVTRGLSTSYPDRVLTTPISEAGIAGIAAGMALRGIRPVVEIMFGDFITLVTDQLMNHIAKFRWMYNEQANVPLVIRTPMGGRRGYGPTHSQTLEKLFLGVPGLDVLAPTSLGDPGKLLLDAILSTNDPILFIENKLQYLLPVQESSTNSEFSSQLVPDHSGGFNSPTYRMTLREAPAPSLTICAYGYMAELARQAISKLGYEHEVFAELVVPTRLAPFEISPLLDSLQRTRRLLAIEEGTLTLGWGAEILARVVETSNLRLETARRLAAKDSPIPASSALEASMLPQVDDIIANCLKIAQNG